MMQMPVKFIVTKQENRRRERAISTALAYAVREFFFLGVADFRMNIFDDLFTTVH